MTNPRRLACFRLWPLRPGSSPRLPAQGYTTAKRFGFGFSCFYLVERAGGHPQLQLTIENSALVGRERITLPASGLLALLCYDPGIFRSYELSTRRATSR